MKRSRAFSLVLTALVILWVQLPLSGQTPAPSLLEAINKRDEPRAARPTQARRRPECSRCRDTARHHGCRLFRLETTVQALLARGADMRLLDVDGAGPLHAAALGGHVGVVELLLDAGSVAAPGAIVIS